MNGDMIVSLLCLGGAMALVASGLAGRRLGLRRWLGLALLWLGIFVAAFAIAHIQSGQR